MIPGEVYEGSKGEILLRTARGSAIERQNPKRVAGSEPG